MENIPRDLGKKLTVPEIPKQTVKKKKWQLMFVGDYGEVITVNNYKTWFSVFAFFFIIVLSSAVIFAFFYFNVNNKNRVFIYNIDLLNHRVKVLEQEKSELEANIVLIESKLKTAVSFTLNQKKSAKSSVKNKKKDISKNKEDEKKKQQIVEKKEVVKSDISVSVDKFKIRKVKENDFIVKFMIKNTSKKLKSISGNIFVILKSDVDYKSWLVSPRVELIKGWPDKINEGEVFSISRYKTVRFDISNYLKVDNIKKCTILIYTESGDLILQEDYPVQLI